MVFLCPSTGGVAAVRLHWFIYTRVMAATRCVRPFTGANRYTHADMLDVYDCIAFSTTPRLLRFSSLPSNSYVLLSGEQLYNQNNADQRMKKSELNKTISVLLPLVQHQASRQFVIVSTPRVPHVGQPPKGHVQVS